MFTEDWADNTTVTGMSDLGLPDRNLQMKSEAREQGWRLSCQRYSGQFLVATLSLLGFLSPILMLILPHADFMNMRNSQLKCEVDCDGLLISFSFKLLVLALGSWAVFYRAPRATLPRIHLFRALLTLLLFIFLLAFWLFYGVRLVEQRRKIQYSDIVQVQHTTYNITHYKLNLTIILTAVRHFSAGHAALPPLPRPAAARAQAPRPATVPHQVTIDS